MQLLSDSGVSITDNITNQMAPSFSGRITSSQPEAGVKVFLQTFIDNEAFTVASTDVLYDVANNVKEVVIASHPLVDGVYDTMYFTVEDLAGNSRQSAGELSITIDTLAPQRPTVDLQSTSDSGLSDTDNITKFESLQFRVASEPGTTLYVKDGNTVVYEILSDGDNLLYVEPSPRLAPDQCRVDR